MRQKNANRQQFHVSRSSQPRVRLFDIGAISSLAAFLQNSGHRPEILCSQAFGSETNQIEMRVTQRAGQADELRTMHVLSACDGKEVTPPIPVLMFDLAPAVAIKQSLVSFMGQPSGVVVCPGFSWESFFAPPTVAFRCRPA